METYLQLCRSNLSNLSRFKSISIVIGNESCDLDSAISAIVLAYVKYHEQLDKLCRTAENDDCDSQIIVFPVLNVPRADLKLRREIVFWFEQVLQFDLNTLICRDEVDYDDLNICSADITLTLVDHNENKELARLLPKARFEEIVDHHQPTFAEGACQVKDPDKTTIDTNVGSCSSLIALRFLHCKLVSQFTKQAICVDSQVALILYGPILLDTICFNHAAKRFNVKDFEAVSKLEDLLKHSAEAETSLFDRNDVYQRLLEAKSSLAGLTFDELLRMDMKIVESLTDNNLAICLSTISGTKLTDLSLKEHLNNLRAFCNDPPASAIFSESRPRLFNAIVLLSADNRIPNNLQRQLALFCANKHLMRTIATCIERNSELELELITASETLRIYNQNNLTATRKMVLPIISTILNGPGNQRSSDVSVNRPDSTERCTRSTNVNSNAKRESSFEISTAEVDPEYLLTFKSKTISVPEFEEFIRSLDHWNKEKNLSFLPNKQTPSTSSPSFGACPNSSENAKPRSDSVGSDSHASAPSSLIQQPDSYYGSYIEDSFVGDFVGEYMDPNNDHHHVQENILVMDADGQNLVMMNPTETISHTHEIEFDFDSFGPQSIIYAGNGTETIKEDVTATAAANNNDTTVLQNVQNEEALPKLINIDGDDGSPGSGEVDSGVKCSTPQSSSFASLPEEGEEEKKDTNLATAAAAAEPNNIDIATELDDTTICRSSKQAGDLNIELNADSGTSSISDILSPSDEAINEHAESDETRYHRIEEAASPIITANENQNELKQKEITDVVEPKEIEPEETRSNALSNSFGRNSTLTRSQRKKVSPQINIKNLIVASDSYTPPRLDPGLFPSLQSADPNQLMSNSCPNDRNGKPIDTNENFIISSPTPKTTNIDGSSTFLNSAESSSKAIIDHPLSISHIASSDAIMQNSNGLSAIGANGAGRGLTRQPSMKKKIAVNIDLVLHDNFEDKEEEAATRLSEAGARSDGIPSEDGVTNGPLNFSEIAPKQIDMNAQNEISEQTVQTANANSSSAILNSDALFNGEGNRPIDMQVIEPYKRVISHGGYMHTSADGIDGSSPAIIIFSACFLPERARKDYHYVMDNLFLYVLTTLHNMIADDYILIYLHNGGGQSSGNNMPTFSWLKRCYQMMDRKLKKNLKGLYILHPTFWLKTLIIMSKPFISSKFSRKLKFVTSIEQLRSLIPIEHVAIPETVKV